MIASNVNHTSDISSKSLEMNTPEGEDLSLLKILPLLGPHWTIDGEDQELYLRLLCEVGRAIGPRDIIDWLLIKDVVALTWDIQRGRRYCQSLMRLRKRHALEKVLMSLMPEHRVTLGGRRINEAAQLARHWAERDESATKYVESLLRINSLSMADAAAQTSSDEAFNFDRIEARAGRCEDRRNKLLMQIERRRLLTAQAVLKATEFSGRCGAREPTVPKICG